MSIIQRWCVAIYLIATPLLYPINWVGDLRLFQERVFQVLGMALVSLFVGNIYLSLFFILNCTLFVYYGNDVGYQQTLNIFIGMMLFMASKSYFKTNKFDSRPILAVFAVSTFFVVLQLLGVDPIHSLNVSGKVMENMTFNDPIGMFGIKAHNAIFAAICAPALAALSPALAIIGSIIVLPILYLSKSTGAVLAYAVGMLFFLYHTYRRIFFAALVALTIAVPSYAYFCDYKFEKNMFVSRFNEWHMTWKYTMSNPFGWGPDSYRNLTKTKRFIFGGQEDHKAGIYYYQGSDEKGEKWGFRYYDANAEKTAELNKDIDTQHISPNFWDNPHNFLLNYWFQYGIAGMLLLWFFLKDCTLRFVETKRSREVTVLASMLLAMCASSMTQFPFEISRIAYLLPILGGAYVSVAPRRVS